MYWKPRHLFLIWSKHWHHVLSSHHCAQAQMCPAVQPDVTAERTLKKFACPPKTNCQRTELLRHGFIYSCRVKVNFLRHVAGSVWGAPEVGVRGHRGHRSPLPPLSQPPQDRAAETRTRRDRGTWTWTWPPAKRHLTRSGPVPGQRRLPAAWMQPGRTLGFFAVERGGQNHSFSLSHHRERETGRNDRSRGPRRGNYLMKKTRPSRVSP